MKYIIHALTLLSLVGCNTQKWGYKTNPDYVLSEAYIAIKESNPTKWLAITTGAPNCKYANEDALKYLNREVLSKTDLNKLSVKLIKEENLESPEYISFFIYHTKTYRSTLVEENNGRILAKLNITCFYGSDKSDPKNEGKASQFLPRKYCAIDKVEMVESKDYSGNMDCFE